MYSPIVSYGFRINAFRKEEPLEKKYHFGDRTAAELKKDMVTFLTNMVEYKKSRIQLQVDKEDEEMIEAELGRSDIDNYDFDI